MKELIITSENRSIYGILYEPEGDFMHPAIIMSHGYNGSHGDWYNEGKYYSEHGYVVYAYDFCGGSTSSRSSGSSTEMTISSEIDDLLTVYSYIKKELSRKTAPMEDRVKFQAGGPLPSHRHRAVPSRSRHHCCTHVRHL